jgi:hypothetical protein
MAPFDAARRFATGLAHGRPKAGMSASNALSERSESKGNESRR